MQIFALAAAVTLGATTFATPAQAQAHPDDVWLSAYVAFAIGDCMSEQGYWTQERAAKTVLEYLYGYKNYPRKAVDRVLEDKSLPYAIGEFIDREGGCPAVTARFMKNAQDTDSTSRRSTLSDTPFRF